MEQTFKDWLQDRLGMALPGLTAQMKMMNLNRPDIATPVNARHSAVLILLYKEGNTDTIILIQRSIDKGVHSGQIALPGGAQEKVDENLIATAIREAKEEINVLPNDIRVIGTLTSLYIPVSNFLVQPVIAYAESKPMLSPSENEVARILYLPLANVFERKELVAVRASHTRELVLNVNAYILEENTVLWGATAMIIAELEALWEEYKQYITRTAKH